MQTKKLICHIDMDSFFASVEQQSHHFLRKRPIAVAGISSFEKNFSLHKARTIIVASSVEAKKMGIKTGMLPAEALRLCPNLIFVKPNRDKYIFLHKKLINIFQQYSDKVEVFSIDEAFLDLTNWLKTNEQIFCFVSKIKNQIKRELGESITCSVGLADNKILAKLASGLNKPNGFVWINEQNKCSILKNIKLKKFCGIGPRINQRLEQLKVFNIADLQKIEINKLQKEFGLILANKLKLISFGNLDEPVESTDDAKMPKSISRAQTLDFSISDKELMYRNFLFLAFKVCHELRNANLIAKTVEFYWRFDDFSNYVYRQTLLKPIDNELLFCELVKQKLNVSDFPKKVRMMSFKVSNFFENAKQLDLFTFNNKVNITDKSIDKINKKFGEFTIVPASLLKSVNRKKHVGGFRYY